MDVELVVPVQVVVQGVEADFDLDGSLANLIEALSDDLDFIQLLSGGDASGVGPSMQPQGRKIEKCGQTDRPPTAACPRRGSSRSAVVPSGARQ